jgi:hypothetical protein
MPLHCHSYVDTCNHYHCHRKCGCAELDDKLEQLDRLEKIRNANYRLKDLIRKVDDLSLETQVEISKATNSVKCSISHHDHGHYCCGSCDGHYVHHHHHVCRLDRYCARCDKLYCCSHCCQCSSNHCVHVEEYHHHHHHHHVYDGNIYPLDSYPTAYYKHCENCDYCRKRYGRSKSSASRSKSQAASHDNREPWKGGPYESKYPWKNTKINQSHLA